MGLSRKVDIDGYWHVRELIGNDSSITLFSDLFAQWNPSVKFDYALGNGSFGTAFLCTVSTDQGPQAAVLKLEVADRHGPSCLVNETVVYQTHGGFVARNHENPVPLLKRALNISRTDHFMTIPIDDGRKAVNILCIERVDTMGPHRIFETARAVFAGENRIDASYRYIVLKLLYSLLYMVQRGVIHLDLKLAHLGFRPCTRELLFLDWGLSVLEGKAYKEKDKTNMGSKRARLSMDHSFGLPRGNLVLTQFARDQPGTPGSRPPFSRKGEYKQSCLAAIWQIAVMIFELFKPVPDRREPSENYENMLNEAVVAKDFEAFVAFALGGKECPDVTCRQCLELVHDLFQGAMSNMDPVKIATQAILSEFALGHIAETVELQRLLNGDGVVVDGYDKDGRIQRPLLVLNADKIGLFVLLLFDSKVGDMASPYCGRRMAKPAGYLTSVDFCMHGLVLDDGQILNGQPCDDLTLQTMLTLRKVGSLFPSSRDDPRISKAGNIRLPDRLKAKALKSEIADDGSEVHYIDMLFRINARRGLPCDWDYKWGNGCGDVALSRERVEKCMRPKGRINDLMMNQEIRDIVKKHRLELSTRGWKDADWKQCMCDRDSMDCAPECRFLSDFQGITSETAKRRPVEGNVWVPPEDAEPEVIQELTVSAASFDPNRFSELIDCPGASLVSGLSDMFPDLFADVESYARERAAHFGYFDKECPPAQLLRKILALIRPRYTPLQAARLKGKKPVSQLELLWQPGAEEGNDGALRSNVQAVLDGNGPLSVIVPFDEDSYVIVYLTGHILAIECMKHLCRHYSSAKAQFHEENSDATDQDFQAAWCGGTVQYIREFYPDVRLEPVRIPVRRGNALAMSSYLPHCGPPVSGMCGFIVAGPEVLSDSREEIWSFFLIQLYSCTKLMSTRCRADLLWILLKKYPPAFALGR